MQPHILQTICLKKKTEESGKKEDKHKNEELPDEILTNSLKQNATGDRDNVSRKNMSLENQHFGEPVQNTTNRTPLVDGKSESESKVNTTPPKSTPAFDSTSDSIGENVSPHIADATDQNLLESPTFPSGLDDEKEELREQSTPRSSNAFLGQRTVVVENNADIANTARQRDFVRRPSINQTDQLHRLGNGNEEEEQMIVPSALQPNRVDGDVEMDVVENVAGLEKSDLAEDNIQHLLDNMINSLDSYEALDQDKKGPNLNNQKDPKTNFDNNQEVNNGILENVRQALATMKEGGDFVMESTIFEDNKEDNQGIKSLLEELKDVLEDDEVEPIHRAANRDKNTKLRMHLPKDHVNIEDGGNESLSGVKKDTTKKMFMRTSIGKTILKVTKTKDNSGEKDEVDSKQIGARITSATSQAEDQNSEGENNSEEKGETIESKAAAEPATTTPGPGWDLGNNSSLFSSSYTFPHDHHSSSPSPSYSSLSPPPSSLSSAGWALGNNSSFFSFLSTPSS